MEKTKLLVSFSGGETSAFMAWWLKKHKSKEYDMIFVFANTGQEREETLQFVNWCDKQFELNIYWIETYVWHGERKGSGYSNTTYKLAKRDGEPFEAMIKKYGIPNTAYPHCTRELKTNPIHALAKALGWKDYYTAIGIRVDEIDRLDKNRVEKRFIYPLAQKEFIPMTKPKINFWWKNQPFKLPLKGYQGNCITCWKKSDRKLYTIAQESERNFVFMGAMEAKYGKFIPPTRIEKAEKEGRTIELPITFFRRNRSAIDICNESRSFEGAVIDDALDTDESCEVHAECTNEN